MNIRNRIKTLLTLTAVLGVAVGSAQAGLVPGGDFQMYKPGTGNTVTAVFGGGNSFGKGVGDGITVLGGGIAEYSDGTTGDTVDLPGWVNVNGSNDLVSNGVGGSTALNSFAAWGSHDRTQTVGSLGTIAGGEIITISVMVGGPDGGPISGDLAFWLMADTDQLIPSAVVDPTLPSTSDFQQISRTFDAAALAGHAGKSLSIIVGVQDSNNIGNRIIWDDVTLDVVVPEPSSLALLGMGGLMMLGRRRRKRA